MTILNDRLPLEPELVPIVQASWLAEAGPGNVKTRLSPLEDVQLFHQALCLNVDAHSIVYEVIKKDVTSLG